MKSNFDEIVVMSPRKLMPAFALFRPLLRPIIASRHMKMAISLRDMKRPVAHLYQGPP